MIRSSVDLPDPLSPSTPIFAPGYIEMLMPRSTSLSGGCTRRRSRIVTMNWWAIILRRYRASSPPVFAPEPVGAAMSGFYDIADEYVLAYAALDPISATDAGIAGHDH